MKIGVIGAAEKTLAITFRFSYNKSEERIFQQTIKFSAFAIIHR